MKTQIAILIAYTLTLFSVFGEDKPNIVLVMADDQGWGDMAYNGHKVLKTPHFDAMAKAGLRFDRFYAAAPVCSPTRASVLTGRHPNRMGCFKWGHSLRPQEVTIAEALKSAGYRTGHFGKWHLGSVRKGSPVNPGASGFDEWLSAENFYDNDPILSREGKAVKVKGESSMIAVDAAIEFLGKHKDKEKPLLAVVWFGSPHSPHRAAPEDLKHYADQEKRKQHFLGEITGMDRAVGKLRGWIADSGLRENTVFWYCSDNGGLPGLGTSGGRKNKGSVYEGGLRVPAILEWPAKIKNPGITAVPCNTTDIFPTVLEMAGVKLEKDKVQPLDGMSLLSLIAGEVKSRSKPMGFWDFKAGGIGTPSEKWMAELLEAQKGGGEPADKARLRLDASKIKTKYPEDLHNGHAAWTDWPWKLHRITPKGKKKAAKETWELYDLSRDPLETTDLIASENKRAEAMKKALKDWQRSVVRSLNGQDYR